jgi:hypothetical protein
LAATACFFGGLVGGRAAAQTQPGTEAGFEIHGKLLSGSAPLGFTQGDGWAQGLAFQGVLDDDGQAVAPFNAKRQLDPNWGNQGDGLDPTKFSGSGNKNDDLIGPGQEPWTWDGGGGGPRKNDLTNTYFHTRLGPADSHRWVFLGAETRSTSGDSHVDFEFNQVGIDQVGAASGLLIGQGPDGGRTIGDFIISIDFRQGGGAPDTSLRLWDGSSFVLTDIPGAVISATNFADIAHGAGGVWKHFSETGAEVELLGTLQLVEAGIDLNALGVDLNVCSTAATFTVKTRSSASFTSSLKDFVLVPFPLEDPPEASASNNGPVCLGAEAQLFAGPDGLSYAWTGPGGFTSTEQNPIVPAAMPGDYCVTVTESPGCEDTACTQIPFFPSPGCFIVGDETVCAGSTCNVYTGPPPSRAADGGGSRGSSPPVLYKWEIEGDGEIVGPTTEPEVRVNPMIAVRTSGDGDHLGRGFLGSYTLTLLTTDAQGCTSECSLTVFIEACEPGEGPSCEGCSPGFWKQPQHFFEWPVPYGPDDLFAETSAEGLFFEDAFPGMTLAQVMEEGGGELIALGRQTVAALLNGASPDVNYPLPPTEVIGMFNDVFPGSDAEYNALKDTFQEFNLEGCPLGN